MVIVQPPILKSPRSDGRLIVSYPKSGRTWVRFALNHFNIDVSFGHAGSATNSKYIGWPFVRFPEVFADVPFAFLHRNPIDTAVSMFYQINRRDLRPWSMRRARMTLPLLLRSHLPPKEINQFVLDPVFGLPNVCAYNRGWLDHLKTRSNCLIITYEGLRAEPDIEFQRLLNFLGETGVTGSDLAEASTFEKMKETESAPPDGSALGVKDRNDPQSAKVRKGKVKGYFDELKPETIDACKAIVAQYGFAA